MSEESPQLARVEDLWFPRETVVIRAEDKIFQVSRAVLAARSTVFSGMVAFPQPPAGDTELIDGSPVVRLHDSAADVTVFLRALFDSSYFMPSPAPVELEVVLASSGGRKEDGWYATTFGTDPIAVHIQIPAMATPAHAIAIAVVGSEVGALWLLPWAYYVASTYFPDELAALQAENQPHVRKCVAARERMLRATITAQTFLTVADRCATEFDCNISIPDKVQSLRDDGLCNDCCVKAARRAQAARSAFWDALPGIFGLPPWDELHAMKRAAMGEGDTDDSMAD
ncbi:hypothetical protein C8R43DRAFT_1143344 [Mycena crocata]|nr:hypothetical protein C8R43DRAFT_1143344 [Mycena crocata]